MKTFRLMLLLLSFIFFGMTGCATQYAYTPPESEAGLKCVAQCLSIKNTCRERELERARVAQKACERNSAQEYLECKARSEEEFNQCQEESEKEYYACLKYAEDRSSCHEEECKEKNCYERRCSESARFSYCENDYRECYQQCGGTIEVVK